MKLILRQTVENLGNPGDIVDVKAGHGRNYLIPQGLAYEASPANIRKIEDEKAAAEERSKRDYLEAKRRAAQMERMTLTFRARAGEDGKLFGSVTGADIADRANEQGLDFEVEKRQVLLVEALKTIGSTMVPIRLFHEVEVEVEVVVEREEA